MSRAVDVATSSLATLFRAGSGAFVGPLGPRPSQPLELYEFEACPFCRKVREAASILDLELIVRPCPKGGTRFRNEVIRRGGKALFPYLVDPNTGVEMYESDDIVRYLWERYGSGGVHWSLASSPIATATGMLASMARAGAGSRVRASRPPEKPLELWSFEASPYCRIAREALSSLELPYRLHNVAKGSPSRAAFVARSGKMQVPYLVDPNTGIALFESAEIVAYLERTYGRDTALAKVRVVAEGV
ncbi:MAG: glutathione S-transferase [Deltaproteobacteria bacterium]|nr:glutathione S-transferase [Deltaproteobacteria bacterium]